MLEGLFKDKVLKMHMDEGRIMFVDEPELRGMQSRDKINLILTDQLFWHKVRGDKVLYFQTDSIMCSNSPASIIDFMTEFDWVGAPWPIDWGYVTKTPDKEVRVGNGGFSVRNRPFILDLLQKTPYQIGVPEDYWYSYHILMTGGKVPSYERAQDFGAEMSFSPKPIGLHKFWEYYSDKVSEVMPFCPPLRAIGPDSLVL